MASGLSQKLFDQVGLINIAICACSTRPSYYLTSFPETLPYIDPMQCINRIILSVEIITGACA